MGRKRWLQKVGVVVVRVLCHLMFWFRVEGKENVPPGKCVICSNHSSGLDVILMGCVIGTRYPFVMMAKKELFKTRFLRWLLTSLGGFPVDRGRADITAVKLALQALKREEKFVIFPQGTRSDTDDVPPHAGVGMIALRSGAPVLPVYISTGKKLFHRIQVKIGPAYYPTPGDRKDPQLYERAAREIMDHIYALKER